MNRTQMTLMLQIFTDLYKSKIRVYQSNPRH